MNITLIYNLVTSVSRGQPEDILADQDSVKTAEAVAKNLRLAGNEVELLSIDEKNIGHLKERKTDLFFNQAFGINSLPKTEYQVAEALAATGVPYTGSDAKAILLTTDKIATKELLLKNGVPTPKFQRFKNCREEINPELAFPLIAKPSNEDCSLGIDSLSVLTTKKQAYGKIEKICKAYVEPTLVEEYIPGRELNVSILGNGLKAEILPISEIIFGPSFKGKFQVVDFAAKWFEDSVAYRETTGVCPAKLDPAVQKEVEEVAKKAFLLTGCRDYARVDIRLSTDGTPYVLEVNANPGIGPEDGMIRSAKAAGYTYSRFLQQIIDVAKLRFRV